MNSKNYIGINLFIDNINNPAFERRGGAVDK